MSPLRPPAPPPTRTRVSKVGVAQALHPPSLLALFSPPLAASASRRFTKERNRAKERNQEFSPRAFSMERHETRSRDRGGEPRWFIVAVAPAGGRKRARKWYSAYDLWYLYGQIFPPRQHRPTHCGVLFSYTCGEPIEVNMNGGEREKEIPRGSPLRANGDRNW